MHYVCNINSYICNMNSQTAAIGLPVCLLWFCSFVHCIHHRCTVFFRALHQRKTPLINMHIVFQGTTSEQDTRFADKKKKLMKSMRFGEGLERKVSGLTIVVILASPQLLHLSMGETFPPHGGILLSGPE